MGRTIREPTGGGEVGLLESPQVGWVGLLESPQVGWGRTIREPPGGVL